jgi:glucose/arabinose dehydrogenase
MAAPVQGAQLVTVVPGGLSRPVFVGHSGDGSERLFIVEQPGIIRVLQRGQRIGGPGIPDPTPTVFLDIQSKVVIGGFGSEQGLLGLAFHPQYIANRRFFVFYTRTGDGALIISEFQTSSTDPNVADPAEKPILTIPHPSNTNHNGGMLAFGPDGYLYIGVGDGGGTNDPANNAQNINTLLGKILRIDIDPPPGSGMNYQSPPTNPFFGPTPGLDEIFAYGMRNPWRFSFDRLVGQQWVADVGQGQREEVDTPIAAGGNYGWRVFEGNRCTNLDMPLCSNPANYIFPVFEYTHSGGRCSITGGYVYQGSLDTFPPGSYIYGDYCTGEIFMWNGTTQQLLMDTSMNISSFGEDEWGELYVVDLGGSVFKFVNSSISQVNGNSGLSGQPTQGGANTPRESSRAGERVPSPRARPSPARR